MPDLRHPFKSEYIEGSRTSGPSEPVENSTITSIAGMALDSETSGCERPLMQSVDALIDSRYGVGKPYRSVIRGRITSG